jgi:hypothetical protein
LGIGLLYGSARVLARLTRGWINVRAYFLVAQPVKAAPSLPHGRGRKIEVREIGPEEALELPVNRPRKALERRFRQGARCMVARSDGEFVGFLWFQLGAYEEDEVRCCFVPTPQDRVSWDFDVFVQPSARLGFGFARLWDETNAILARQGIRWTVSRISMLNASSIGAHKRLGLKRVGAAAFVLVGKAQLMISTVKPFVHLAVRPQSRPTLRVSVEE